MGCLKLTYRSTLEVVKPAQGFLFSKEKTDAGNYRYGFNGMEKDDEVKGEGNSYTTEFRQYDSRIGRWLSVDPLIAQFPWSSPYVSMSNNPITRTDPLGNSDGWVEDGEGNVNWDKNTNSQKDFDENYSGQEGFSYVSDKGSPNSYTLPNGDGVLLLKEWDDFEVSTEEEESLFGPTGVFIDLEFVPSNENAKGGWYQTVESNQFYWRPEGEPGDYVTNSVNGYFDGPNHTTKQEAEWFDSPPSMSMDDIPTKEGVVGTNIHWKATSSIVINSNIVISVSWGFNISGETGVTSPILPIINTKPSNFHVNGAEKLK